MSHQLRRRRSMTTAEIQRNEAIRYARELSPDFALDRGVSYAVKVLRGGGVETYESCEGGKGHSFSEPTVRFFGGASAGYHAAGVAISHGLPVRSLRRFWRFIDAELEGPNWEITFDATSLKAIQRRAEKENRI